MVGVFWPVREILARPLQPPPDPADRRRAWSVTRLAAGLMCLAGHDNHVGCRYEGGDRWEHRARPRACLSAAVPVRCTREPLRASLGSPSTESASALAVTELQAPQSPGAVARHRRYRGCGRLWRWSEFQGTQTNLKRGLESSIRGMDSSTDVWVTPRGSSSLQTTIPFKARDASALARLPGVSQIGVYRGSFLDWGKRRLWVIAPAGSIEHPIPPSQLLSGNPSPCRRGESGEVVGRCSRRRSPPNTTCSRRGVYAAITTAHHSAGCGVDDESRMATGRDRSSTRATTRGRGRVAIRAHTRSRLPPAASAATVRGRVRSALGSGPGLTVETAGEREQRHYAVSGSGSIAADTDPAARADRRDPRDRRRDGRDDLAAPRSHRR